LIHKVIPMTLATLPAQTTDTTPEYALAPSVLYLPAPDGSGRLFDLDGQFFAISATGAELLAETLGHGPAAAAEIVACRYGVDTEAVRADLETFLAELRRQKLLWCPASGRPPRHRGTTRPLLAPALRLAYACCRSVRARTWMLLTLARLSFRLFGWTRTLAVWRRCAVPGGPHGNPAAVAREIGEAVRGAASGYLFGASCKERSLCAWALCRAAGVRATLVLGVNLYPLSSHCWCEYDGEVLTDYADRCENFTPAVRYE
jgi:hypothetical protein